MYDNENYKGLGYMDSIILLLFTSISYILFYPIVVYHTFFRILFQKNADWIKSSATKFDPEKCTVTTAEGDEISYEYLVIAVGLQLRYDQVIQFDISELLIYYILYNNLTTVLYLIFYIII